MTRDASKSEGVRGSCIVVGTDGSETATRAVQTASWLAALLQASLFVVSAYRPLPERAVADGRRDAPADVRWQIGPRSEVDGILERAREIAALEGVEADAVAREGLPADAILEVATECEADIIVVGNKGMRGALRALRSSVPNAVSHRAACSVLIVDTT